MLLPAGGIFALFNISDAVCESWPRSDRPEASMLVLKNAKLTTLLSQTQLGQPAGTWTAELEVQVISHF